MSILHCASNPEIKVEFPSQLARVGVARALRPWTTLLMRVVHFKSKIRMTKWTKLACSMIASIMMHKDKSILSMNFSDRDSLLILDKVSRILSLIASLFPLHEVAKSDPVELVMYPNVMGMRDRIVRKQDQLWWKKFTLNPCIVSELLCYAALPPHPYIATLCGARLLNFPMPDDELTPIRMPSEYISMYLPEYTEFDTVFPITVPAEFVQHYAEQLLYAVLHLHSQGCAHLDIKPGNVLIDIEEEQLKLIDFDTSLHFLSTDALDAHIMPWPIGTSCSMAPNEAHGISARKMDFYGIGATVYAMANFGVCPGKLQTISDHEEFIRAGGFAGMEIDPDVREKLGEGGWRFVSTCMEVEEDDRFGVEAAMLTWRDQMRFEV